MNTLTGGGGGGGTFTVSLTHLKGDSLFETHREMEMLYLIEYIEFIYDKSGGNEVKFISSLTRDRGASTDTCITSR